MGLVAPRHVGSSWTKAQTRVPCIGRQILNNCATRGVLIFLISKLVLYVKMPKFLIEVQLTYNVVLVSGV